MKFIHSALLTLAISTAVVSTAQARDSFNLGINVGGFGYAPPVAYYPAPVYYNEPVYYSQPVTYYHPAPRYYGHHGFAPTVVSFGYQNFGGHHGWDRGGRGHHGWDRGGRGGRGGWDRGGRGGWDRDGRGGGDRGGRDRGGRGRDN